MSKFKFETECVHGNYFPTEGEAFHLPISQSTTFRYDDASEMAKLFDLESDKFMYSRLGNPTVNKLEEKMALLEGGSAAICTSSGQAATLLCILNLAKAGDHILACNNLYGGTYNLLNVTLRNLGIETTFFDQNMPKEEILKLAKPNTKALFGETLGNPALSILDFKKMSEVSKTLHIPLVVDNTLATPALCKPIEFGADIVIHSLTKYADGHASCVGGCVIESGKFDWAKDDKFLGMIEPDNSYHGLKFYEKFGPAAFSVKMRAQLLRDLGTTMAPMNAYLIHQGLQTLHLRMERHSTNALALANFLENQDGVAWVNYPGLKDNKYNELANTYMSGCSGVLTFGVKGGKKAGELFLSKLKLASLVVHVGDVRTCVLHPSSTTHRQLSEEAQIEAGISPELIRVSVGIESIDDIINDFSNALKEVSKCL